jgi:phosphate transport system permease protein
MTDITMPQPRKEAIYRADKRLKRRRRAEARFRVYGLIAVVTALGFLGVLLCTVIVNSIPAFTQTVLALEVDFDPETIDPKGTEDPTLLARADYGGLLKAALRETFPEAASRKEKRLLYSLLSNGAQYELAKDVAADPAMIGTRQKVWLAASDRAEQLYSRIGRDDAAPTSDNAVLLGWLRALQEKGDLETRFNTTFFTAGDSREPEQAGILGAVVGSGLTLLVTFLCSFPLGVLAALYLEEFAPKSRWTDLIEVNINNLAAVPSIIFGLLGLAVFLNFFGMPRSAPLVGGLVLSLMTLPTIIIAARAALKAVPPSIREAALALGASPLQVAIHHTLPLAAPGILTGTIIGMAGALGETAPLLMIGMVAFIVDIPSSITDPAAVLPVQIYLWADSPERGFAAKTNAAILVLLGFLILMNLLAVLLRRRFERRW